MHTQRVRGAKPTFTQEANVSVFRTHNAALYRHAYAVDQVAVKPCSSAKARSAAGRKALQVCNIMAEAKTMQPPGPMPVAAKIEVDGESTHAVTNNVTLLRGSCSGRLKYEVEFNLKRGTTDNAYVVKVPGTENAVLVDVPFEAYAETFVAALSSITAPTNLTHIIITHLAPNRLPALELVLKGALENRSSDNKLKLVLTNPAAQLLNTAWDKPDKAALLSQVQLVIAKPGTVNITENYTVQLIPTPTPRWPDLMAVHIPSEQLLFTGKLFSAHSAPSVVGDKESAFDVGGVDTYGNDWRYFFDCMLAPVARQAAAALDKLEGLAVVSAPASSDTLQSQGIPNIFNVFLNNLKKLAATPAPKAAEPETVPGQMLVSGICPMHGPVVRSSLQQLLRDYREWVDNQVKASEAASISVLYASAYGNTTALAQAISRGIIKAGVGVNMVNLELTGLDEVSRIVQEGKGFVLGSPTLGGHMPTPVQVTLGALIRESRVKGQPCGVFGSFGWSGEAVDEMEQRLQDAGFAFSFKPIRVKFKPTAKDLQVCEESGRALAIQVKRKLKAKETNIVESGGRVAMASGCQLAMGRVVGSLSVITARDEDASSAMLASWISQASFDPPGVTVAVKKDRAMEQLLMVGGKFCVSMLTDGKEKPLMKALTKPFLPGQNRLEGIETTPAPVTDLPIISSSNAYLECAVASRMEAGDHWVIYGTVIGGKVQDETALTSVHHRKVGNHY